MSLNVTEGNLSKFVASFFLVLSVNMSAASAQNLLTSGNFEFGQTDDEKMDGLNFNGWTTSTTQASNPSPCDYDGTANGRNVFGGSYGYYAGSVQGGFTPTLQSVGASGMVACGSSPGALESIQNDVTVVTSGSYLVRFDSVHLPISSGTSIYNTDLGYWDVTVANSSTPGSPVWSQSFSNVTLQASGSLGNSTPVAANSPSQFQATLNLNPGTYTVKFVAKAMNTDRTYLGIDNVYFGSPFDSNANLTSSSTVIEPVGLDTTADMDGEAVDLFDFTISDGGGGDGLATTISQVVINVSGTASDTVRNQITWRLDGPDASNVTGTYNASNDTITFSSLSISITDSASETYTINGYFNNNTNVIEDQTIILSVDGDTDLTVGASGTQFGATTAVNNSTGTTIDVVATTLAVTTQPVGSVSGSALTTQPVITAQDAFGNTDVDFTETITLTEASAGTLSGDVDVAAVSGVATFTDVTYTATADQQSFTLTADDESGVGSDFTALNANAIISDVVATTLAFNTQPAPLTIEHGTATSFTTVPVVVAQNANGITDTGYTTDITIVEVNGAGSATLSVTGDTDSSPNTASITPSSGVATFTGLSGTYSATGSSSETFNLQASSGALTTATSNQLISSDTTAPTVSSVSVPSNGSYKLGDLISFTVNTSEAVAVTGTPQLALTVGATTRQAVYVSGSSTSTSLVFSYTVQNSDADADGIAVATSITASGSTLKDGAGNDLILTLNNVGSTSSILVNTSAPSVSIINLPSIVNSTSAFRVTFEFSEGVLGFGVGGITVTNGSPGSFSVTDDNTYTAYITPDGSGDVSIDVASGVALDIAGNANIAANQVIVLYDPNDPTLFSSSPVSGATGVPVGTDITLTFSESVQAGSGNITLYDSGDNVIKAFDVGNDVTISGATVTLDPDTDLLSQTGYYIQVDATAIGDLAGNSFAGISDKTTLNFTAADAVAPTLSSASPTDNATGVAVGANIVLTFNESVQAGTGSIVISDGDSDTRTIPISDPQVTISGSTVTIDPTANLSSLTSYYVQIASTSIKDIAGNAYLGISNTTTLNFTTLDNVAPIATFNPLNGATDVAVDTNITITFDEAIRLNNNSALTNSNVDGLITLKGTNSNGSDIAFDATISGNVITVNPLSDFSTSQQVYVSVGAAIEDTSDNAFTGASATFTVFAGSPASEFLSREAEIRHVIVADAQRNLRSTLAANTNISRDARERLLQYQNLDGSEVSRSNVAFDVNGGASFTNGIISSSGTFYELFASADGKQQRLFFGDFDIQRDADASVTATLNAKIAWEQMLSDQTLYGYFIGGQFAQSDIEGTLSGDNRRIGLEAGAYTAHQLGEALYFDGFASLGLSNNTLKLADEVLTLNSDYFTKTFVLGAALSGLVTQEAYEIRPELAFNFGKAWIGDVGFTGAAYGMTDDTLSLDAGNVTLASLTFRPEVVVPLDGRNPDNSNTEFSFSSRFVCEYVKATTSSYYCGTGVELGFSSVSKSGLSTADIKLIMDRIDNGTRSSVQLGLEHRF